MPTYAIYRQDTGAVEEYRTGDDVAQALARWAPSDPEVYAAEEVPDDQPRALAASSAIRLGHGQYIDRAQTLGSVQAAGLARVNAERLRRIALGVTVDVGAGRMVPVDTRDERDLANLNGLTTVAMLRQAAGDDSTIDFRGADNDTYALTPAELIAMGTGVAAAVAAIYAWSWATKDAVGAAASTEAVAEVLLAAEVP